MDRKFKENFLSLGGIGRNKKMPGTAGSFLAAVFLVLVKNYFASKFLLLAIMALAIAGLYYFAQRFIKNLREEKKDYDQPWIVIDEFIGMLIAGLPFLLTRPFNGWLLIFGFLLFRFFDILKPWPINKADALNSPRGVLLDDILAGIASVLILAAALLVIKIKTVGF